MRSVSGNVGLILQACFSDLEHAAKNRTVRLDCFLSEIKSLTPWTSLLAAIEPFHPRCVGLGRPPTGLKKMLCMYVAQQCSGVSDEAIEDALCDSQAIRRFAGIDLGRESASDAATLLTFRGLLGDNKLTAAIFETINQHLAVKGLTMRDGAVVDATIIAAPFSTNSREGKRDPEMHQTKKGIALYYGMKAHVGVDADSGLTHTLVTTLANAAYIREADNCCTGNKDLPLAMQAIGVLKGELPPTPPSPSGMWRCDQASAVGFPLHRSVAS